jgi:hypothetical protein
MSQRAVEQLRDRLGLTLSQRPTGEQYLSEKHVQFCGRPKLRKTNPRLCMQDVVHAIDSWRSFGFLQLSCELCDDVCTSTNTARGNLLVVQSTDLPPGSDVLHDPADKVRCGDVLCRGV